VVRRPSSADPEPPAPRPSRREGRIAAQGKVTRAAFLLVVIVAAAPARPADAASFDCANARSPVEKAICGNQELSAADEALAASYKAVLAQLSPDAQDRVRDGQRDWLKYVRTICPPGGNIAQCLKDTLSERKEQLDKSVTKSGDLVLYTVERFSAEKVKKEPWNGEKFATHQSSYPQLDRPATDGARAWNREVAASAKKAEMSPEDDTDSDTDLGFTISILSPDLISGEFSASLYAHGAAHPTARLTPFNWLLKQGHDLRAEDLFDRAKPWRKGLSMLCVEAFSDFDTAQDFCAPPKLHADNWTIDTDGLGIQFQQYEIGPYVLGAPLQVIPWDKLKPLLVADPPFPIPPR
jgi:uncharacterized protein